MTILPFRSAFAPRQCWLRAVVFLLASFASLASATAQTATANLSGRILDEQGRAIPRVSVSIYNVDTANQRQARTNNDGVFTFPLLPPRTYKLTTRSEGFAAVELPNIELNVDDQHTLQITLKVGQIGETVVVRSETTLSESAAVGTVVNREFVENMPLSGRTLQSLFDLTPGVLRSAGIEGGQFVVNGQRADANYYLVDGVGANVNTSALPTAIGIAGQLPSLSALNTTHTLVSLDALQEFKILTSTYAPEFGRTSGGQVSLVTRSGTNQFTGSAYEYWRNEVLEANDSIWLTVCNSTAARVR